MIEMLLAAAWVGFVAAVSYRAMGWLFRRLGW